MAVVCPTVLAQNAHSFREQMERVEPFAKRIQIDLTDGEFAPAKTVTLGEIWWPDGIKADIHLMYKHPLDQIDEIIRLKPHMVIVHAEAESYPHKLLEKLKNHGIKLGLAVLADTEVESIKDWLNMFDHLLIFSGDLGNFGGHADLSLLNKIKEAKAVNPNLEIGWDGGINDYNAAQLVAGGVDVLNVGGFIQKAEDPSSAYAKLEKIANI